MASNLNYKNVLAGAGSENGPRSGSARIGSYSLSRQSSIYSLTFDEFQSGLGKDFGSMNMDEFLKNVWFAEETQGSTAPPDAPEGNLSNLSRQFSLQRQGSLTLPRTLSLKTVDEVFRDMIKESMDQGNVVVSSLPRRQPKLREMTLEEFLVRAGIVREDDPSINISSNEILDGNYWSNAISNGNSQGQSDVPLVTGFGQPGQANGNLAGMPYQGIVDSSANNVNALKEIRSQPVERSQIQQQQKVSWLNNQYNQSPVVQQTKQQQLQLFQEQPSTGYASPTQLTTNVNVTNPSVGSGLSLSRIGGVAGNGTQVRPIGFTGVADLKASTVVVSPAASALNSSGIQPAAGISPTGLGYSSVAVTTVSLTNPLSSDGLTKNYGDNSSLSPVTYAVNGGLRGRRCGPVERVIERRQRRMIKNRESAARSRARKQAYTMELEAEISKLKEENIKLQKKQAEIMEIQKAQILEKLNQQAAPKKRCLRRTSTGPW